MLVGSLIFVRDTANKTLADERTSGREDLAPVAKTCTGAGSIGASIRVP